MPLTVGVRLGPYEILAPLGAGGMGEVYRARDTRLDRTVAVKILPAALADDPQFRERFDREARAISQLTHPHICALYDVGEAPSPEPPSARQGAEGATAAAISHEPRSAIRFLVMECLEGETLGDRLQKGALPLDQALTLAIQIADALDAAHRAGIVHRDLKPGNVMLTKAGAKLLDFGLAKARGPAQAGHYLREEAQGSGRSVRLQPDPTPTMTPTTPAALTLHGAILGTVQYMSPEQIEGVDADARTDIFAFGCVVYEMVTGAKAFTGKTSATLMSAIMQSEPPPMAAAGALDSRLLDHLVRRCLAKDPDARWQTIHDVKEELRWIADAPPAQAAPAIAKPGRDRRAWAAAGVFALALAAAAPVVVSHVRETPAPTERVQFAVGPPEHADFAANNEAPFPVVSPDGRRLAFLAISSGGQPQIWIRSIASVDAQPLPGTEGANNLFWSPDSRSIGFFAGNKLETIEVSGGPVQALCDVVGAGNNKGGSWNREGVIVFARSASGSGLFRVSANGGEPTPVTTLDASRKETSHRHPFFLPDGRHFVYFALPTNTIRLASLDSKETTLLFSADSRAVYAPPGFLLFIRQGTLVAQPFDAAGLKVTGEAVPIAERVRVSAQNNWGSFTASTTGVLAYRTGASSPPTQLGWVDRAGKPLGSISQPGPYSNPVLSLDGARLAVQATDAQQRTSDIWVIELARGVASRFTFDPADDIYPVWSPDGSHIAFGSNRQAGAFNIYQKLSNGAGADELLLKADAESAPYDWSRDGHSIVFRHVVSGLFSLGLLPLSADRKPLVFEPSTGGTTRVQGQVSPDGRWLAYASQESGRYEIFVKNFPQAGGKWQISKDGGVSPRWRGDGKELFYYAADSRLTAVPIGGATALELGTATPLFSVRLLGGPTVGLGLRQQYDVARDGQRFLVNVPTQDTLASPITVVLNWTAGLKK